MKPVLQAHPFVMKFEGSRAGLEHSTGETKLLEGGACSAQPGAPTSGHGRGWGHVDLVWYNRSLGLPQTERNTPGGACSRELRHLGWDSSHGKGREAGPGSSACSAPVALNVVDVR